MDQLLAGVDIGGSHITVALINACNADILHHTYTRLHVNSRESADTILATWCKAIDQSFAKHNVSPTQLGIAMPGPFDYEKGISLIKNQNKYDALYGVNVKQRLAEKLNIPAENIAMTNDAACFLKGEMFGGVSKTYKRVLGFTLGTGFGSARSIDGITEDADLWCSPFKNGIAEDYLSTRWFVKRYFELSNERVEDVKGLTAMGKENMHVQQVFAEFSDHLAEFLLPYVRNEHVELIILGGNIAQAFPLFSATLLKALKENNVSVEIRQSRLGENAALVGAASCFCNVSAMATKHA